MFNVDTIFLGMNFEDRQKEVEMLAGRTKVMTDYEYIKTVNEKIRNKLYLDDDNRRKLKKVETFTESVYIKKFISNFHIRRRRIIHIGRRPIIHCEAED